MKKERLLDIDGSVNFRELGGYTTKDGRTIKWQKLLRSGDLSRLTAKDVKKIGQLWVTLRH